MMQSGVALVTTVVGATLVAIAATWLLRKRKLPVLAIDFDEVRYAPMRL